ncbi:NnrS family protein [bacterium]|nr:NnrS family protein [bacterium]
MAALSAALWILAWVGTLHGAPMLRSRFAAADWHSHEMVFGYAMAVVAGFLLTAVRNWTRQETARGGALAGLAILWAVARLLNFVSSSIPAVVTGVVDAAFPLALAYFIGRPIFRARNKRNYGFVAWMVGMGLLNLTAHLLAGAGKADLVVRTSRVAVDLLMLLIVVEGGRVIPNFTKFHLKLPEVQTSDTAGWASIISVALVVAAGVVWPDSALVGVFCVAAAGANLWRMASWRTGAAVSSSILFFLHLAYGWLVVGYGLRALIVFTGRWPGSAATHALTAGALGMITFGMMCWVGLAHTGRPVKAGGLIKVAYTALFLAALMRVFTPVIAPTHYIASLGYAGALWAVAFILYLVVYTPILLRPAAGGRPD